MENTDGVKTYEQISTDIKSGITTVGTPGAITKDIMSGITMEMLDFSNSRKGPQGPQGEKGPDGTPGDNGVQGEKGTQGEQGAQGVRGEQGIPGDGSFIVYHDVIDGVCIYPSTVESGEYCSHIYLYTGESKEIESEYEISTDGIFNYNVIIGENEEKKADINLRLFLTFSGNTQPFDSSYTYDLSKISFSDENNTAYIFGDSESGVMFTSGATFNPIPMSNDEYSCCVDIYFQISIDNFEAKYSQEFHNFISFLVRNVPSDIDPETHTERYNRKLTIWCYKSDPIS